MMAFRWTARPPLAASQREALLPVPAVTRREAWPLELEPTVSPLREPERAASRSRALPLEPAPVAFRPKVASQREALLPVPALPREVLPLELEQAASQPRALPLAQALSLPAAWLRQAPSE